MSNVRTALPRIALAIVALAGSMTAVNAYADPQTANHNLYVNMLRGRIVAAPEFQNLNASPTPVRHLYRLKNARGEFMGYVNEAGTILGDFNGFSVYSTTGAPVRKMTSQEAAALRHEIMDNLDTSRMIKVVHGDGGGRKLLMFSAIECPGCRDYEMYARTVPNLNTTFYVVPKTLIMNAPDNTQANENVRRLWCSGEDGEAWKTYWAKGTIPQARECKRELTAEESYSIMRDLMSAVGNKVKSVPTIMREDGAQIAHPTNVPALKAAWGPTNVPPPQPVVWLGAAERQPDVVPGQAEGQPRQIKVNPKDLLKKLFN